MRRKNNTVVMVDINGDGIMDVTNTLNMGESMFVNGGVLCRGDRDRQQTGAGASN